MLALASLRKWDAETTVSALGHQLAQTAGSLQSIIDGSLAKRFQPAMVAKDVLVGAALAQAGIDGPSNVFEGRAGFFSLYQDGEFDREVLLQGAETAELVSELSLKPYPSCRFTHAGIDLGIQMRGCGVDPDQVALHHLSDERPGHEHGWSRSSTTALRTLSTRNSASPTRRGSLCSVAAWLSAISTRDRSRTRAIGKFAAEKNCAFGATETVDFLAMSPVVAQSRIRTAPSRVCPRDVSGSPEHRLDATQLRAKASDCLGHGGAAVTGGELWDTVQALRDNGPVGELLAATRTARRKEGKHDESKRNDARAPHRGQGGGTLPPDCGTLQRHAAGGRGADVIKVEPPQGELTRHREPIRTTEHGTMSGYFASLNRRKRSIALDLKSEAGSSSLRLVEDADVFITNMRRRALEPPGLPPDDAQRALPLADRGQHERVRPLQLRARCQPRRAGDGRRGDCRNHRARPATARADPRGADSPSATSSPA